MPQNGKLMPNLDEKTTKVLNLTVLQRVDPFVKEILITAGHVTFYEFNANSNQWSRKDVEGSLFVVKRNTQPRFQFIVMNRRNTDNLVENLLGDFEYEIQLPYLLYRNASQEVNGIWFYNARECEDVANLFNRILNAYSKVPSKTKVSSKSEFEELESVPTMSVMDGPLEPSSSMNNTVPDVNDDPSFVNFFSTAMNIGGFSNPATSPQPNHSSATVISTSRVAASNLPALQIPSPLPPRTPETFTLSTRSTDLVKPSSFFTPPLSPSTSPVTISPITAALNGPPLTPPGSLQRPYGTPMLQPFPPPTPGPLLTPSTPNYGPVLDREKVREALQVLVQDNQFIDMVYRAMMHVHQS